MIRPLHPTHALCAGLILLGGFEITAQVPIREVGSIVMNFMDGGVPGALIMESGSDELQWEDYVPGSTRVTVTFLTRGSFSPNRIVELTCSRMASEALAVRRDCIGS